MHTDQPLLLVITGAAATGKSTVGAHLRTDPRLLVVDGDVLGSGAAAVADGRRDYVGFWRYVLAICREVRGNGVVPVVPCICLPEQVLSAVEDEVVHFLALLSDAATIRRRIRERVVSEVPSPETHVRFDTSLRRASVAHPHSWTQHDVAQHDLACTRSVADAWAARHVSGCSGT